MLKRYRRKQRRRSPSDPSDIIGSAFLTKVPAQGVSSVMLPRAVLPSDTKGMVVVSRQTRASSSPKAGALWTMPVPSSSGNVIVRNYDGSRFLPVFAAAFAVHSNSGS